MKANWERILLAVLASGLVGYGAVSTDSRTGIRDDVNDNARAIAALDRRMNDLRAERSAACMELRDRVIEVLFAPGAHIPREFRDQAQRILQEATC